MKNIDIKQGEFGVAEGGFTITTGVAGPCILVGIFDTKHRRAYLIHDDIAAHNGKLKEFFEKVRSESNPEDLIVKVRGGSEPPSSVHFEMVEMNRKAVMSQIEGLLVSKKVDILWRKSCMGIDPNTGKFKLRCI